MHMENHWNKVFAWPKFLDVSGSKLKKHLHLHKLHKKQNAACASNHFASWNNALRSSHKQDSVSAPISSFNTICMDRFCLYNIYICVYLICGHWQRRIQVFLLTGFRLKCGSSILMHAKSQGPYLRMPTKQKNKITALFRLCLLYMVFLPDLVVGWLQFEFCGWQLYTCVQLTHHFPQL